MQYSLVPCLIELYIVSNYDTTMLFAQIQVVQK